MQWGGVQSRCPRRAWQGSWKFPIQKAGSTVGPWEDHKQVSGPRVWVQSQIISTLSLFLTLDLQGHPTGVFTLKHPEVGSTTSAVSSDSIQSMTIASANLAVRSQTNWDPYGSPRQHRALPEHPLPEQSVNSTPLTDVLLSISNVTAKSRGSMCARSSPGVDAGRQGWGLLC